MFQRILISLIACIFFLAGCQTTPPTADTTPTKNSQPTPARTGTTEPALSITPEERTPTSSPTVLLANDYPAPTDPPGWQSGYPVPISSPTPIPAAMPFQDCARTPGLTGCDPSAPQLAGHVAFYDLENGRLVGIDLKTGEGWAVAMPMPEDIQWSPDGSLLLVQMNYPEEQKGNSEYILFERDGKVVDQFTENRYVSWQPQGAELRKNGEIPIVRSENGEEAQLGYTDRRRTILYRTSESANWQTEDLDVVAHELPLEIYGWLPGTPNVIFTQLSGISTYSHVAHGKYIFLFNTQTNDLTFLRNFQGHIKPQFSNAQGSKLAIINLFMGMNDNTLAILDGTTGEIVRPLPREPGEFESYSLWQMGWQPGTEDKEGLFVLMVNLVETNISLPASEMFPKRGIYFYDRTDNEAQMIREIPKDRVGGNFHFMADGRYLLYNEGPQESRDARFSPRNAETRLYVREMDTSREWLLLDRQVNPGEFLGYIHWDLIAITME